MKVEFEIKANVKKTPRVLQVSGMFDAPVEDKISRRYLFDFPYDDEPWSIGLIVGASGSGKTQVARHTFDESLIRDSNEWSNDSSVIDCIDEFSVEEITGAFSSVGFNTIPNWMKPYRCLSNGEKFRVDLARLLLENDFLVYDEFTSIVDRQVAKNACHSIQKYVRRQNKKFVALSCHYDVIDWLQPDWVLYVDTCEFKRRRLRSRPNFECEISRVHRKAWKIFAPFHYMRSDINTSARCYVLFCNGEPTSFVGMMHLPISNNSKNKKHIYAVSRFVTLPDWQGLGLAFVLLSKLAGAYQKIGRRFRMYPAHPSLVFSFQKSQDWHQIKPYGVLKPSLVSKVFVGKNSGRSMCAIFEWCGGTMGISLNDARSLIG
jgi:GNAT superfamily N-acetyltransferase